MYESYTRQSLPEKDYRALLGSAICVFNSNFAFIIENMLHDEPEKYDWHELISLEGGKLQRRLRDSKVAEYEEIFELFDSLREKRNRIIHSFRITNEKGEQSLATRDKDGSQFEISEGYLIDFIKENERLSSQLHCYRGY